MRLPIVSYLVDRFRVASIEARIDRLQAEVVEEIVTREARRLREDSWDDDDEDDRDDWRSRASGGKGAWHSPWESLDTARGKCRDLVRRNPTGKGLVRSMLRFALRSPGITYKLGIEEARKKEIEEFIYRASRGFWSRDTSGRPEPWSPKQRESAGRALRDGEMLLRFFDRGSDEFHWRHVDPEKIAEVVTSAGDVEDVKAFRIKRNDSDIQGELVDAAECVWWKIGSDANEKRGVPWLFANGDDIKRYAQWFHDMGILVHMRTAIALLRKHKASPAQIAAFADAQKTGTRNVTDQGTKRSLRQRKYRAGSVLDVGAGTEYEYLEPNVDVGKLEGFPRQTGLRLVQGTGLAEYVATGDCSNAALASLQISEGPMAAEIEFFQQDIMDFIERPRLLRTLEWGIRWGHVAGKLDELDEALELAAPRFQRRDRRHEVSADKEIVAAGGMSVRTMAERDGLDPDQELERIAEEEERQVYPEGVTDKNTTVFKPQGAAEALYRTSAGTNSSRVNKTATKPLVNHTDLDEALLLLAAFKENRNQTGDYIGVPSDLTLAVPMALRATGLDIVGAFFIERDDLSSGAGPRRRSGNRHAGIKVVASPQFDARSTDTWYLGDPRAQFTWVYKKKAFSELRVKSLESWWDRDVLAEIKSGEYGEIMAEDDCYFVQCPGS